MCGTFLRNWIKWQADVETSFGEKADSSMKQDAKPASTVAADAGFPLYAVLCQKTKRRHNLGHAVSRKRSLVVFPPDDGDHFAVSTATTERPL